MPRERIDLVLVARGLATSREEAQRLVLAGLVIVSDQRVDKPGQRVDPDAPIRVRERSAYASRAGTKLASALDAFSLPVQGRLALDAGLSTGGFTDCLLQRGVGHVVGVDVGYGQVALKLRDDPRVTVMERTNLRHLAPDRLPYRPDLVTLDLSFISLALVLPAVRALVSDEADVVCLVKPQFEVGRGRVGKGGIVRDPALHRECLEQVAAAARAAGFHVRGAVPSSITGTDGNREFLLHLTTRPGGAEPDLAGVVST